VRDFEDVDFVVAFKVNDARGVFVEEVVCHHKAIVIAAQRQVVRSVVLTEADNRYLLQVGNSLTEDRRFNLDLAGTH